MVAQQQANPGSIQPSPLEQSLNSPQPAQAQAQAQVAGGVVASNSSQPIMSQQQPQMQPMMQQQQQQPGQQIPQQMQGNFYQVCFNLKKEKNLKLNFNF